MFGRWADRPLRAVGEVRDENVKRYPDARSRYAEPAAAANRKNHRSGAQQAKTVPSDRRRCVWIDRQISSVYTSGDPRSLQSVVLSPAERAYLNLIEGGRFDRAASAVGYVLLSGDAAGRRVRGPPLDEAVVGALTTAAAAAADDDDDGSTAMALLRAALACGDQARSGRPRNAELFAMAALSQLAADGGRPDERLRATCLYAAGRIYADVVTCGRDDRARVTAVRFLDWARRAADDHRDDWPLPADVRDATGGVPVTGGGGVWTAACFAEHRVLLDAARDLDPVRALRAVHAAYRLLKSCGVGGLHRRASVAYELGTRHAAVGSRNLAAEYFDECVGAVAAAGAPHDRDVDLEARLDAARMVPGPSGDGVLARIASQALHRRDGRLLAKAIGARAKLSANANRLNEAYHRFALAHRLSVSLKTDDASGHDSDRLCAAMCRTCAFMQSNFRSLNGCGFDLLAEPRLWTGVRRPLVVWSRPGGRMYLNADRFQDGLVDAEARKLIRRIASATDEETAGDEICCSAAVADDSPRNDRKERRKVLRFEQNESLSG